MVGCYLALIALLALTLVAKSLSLGHVPVYDPILSPILFVSLGLSLVGWLVVALRFSRIVAAVGNEGLAIIGLFAGLQFAVSFAAAIADTAFFAITGPFAPFIMGLGDEGARCLLLAVLVTILPRPGVLMLSSVTVALLNAIVSGNLNMSVPLFVGVGAMTGEACLAILRVTTGSAFQSPRQKPSGWMIARMAAAIGFANGVKLLVQFCLYFLIFRVPSNALYITAVAGMGLVYGAPGAALGTIIGYRLRRTAR
jgi:hypothetical protein